MAKRVILGRKLDSAAVDALRDQLLDARAEDVVLDGSRVELLGGLCLELLLSAKSIWAGNGLGFTLETPSAHLTENMSRFGLTDDFLVADGASA